NVTLVKGEIDGPEVRAAVKKNAGPQGGADVVIAARVLHHAKAPARAMHRSVELARPPKGDAPGGAVCVLDYEAHDDEALRDQQADLWLGFEPAKLQRIAEDAGLLDIHIRRLPAPWQGEGPDRHLPWQLLVGWRGARND